MKNNIFLLGCLFVTAFLCVACGTQKVELYSDTELSGEPLSQSFSSKDTDSYRLSSEKENDYNQKEYPLGEEDSQKRQSEEYVPNRQSEEAYQGQESKETIEESIAKDVYVQVGGAVINPGVYRMNQHQRVYEAVLQAGGMTEEAAVDAVNQSLEITDGQMIYIPTLKEWQQQSNQLPAEGQAKQTEGQKAAEDTQEDGLININTADSNELCTIPGIGATRAEQIITYREKNGKFSTIEDIKKVSGIKNGLYEKIKDKIKVK